MKIKFLATGSAPDNYSFNGDEITAYYGDTHDTFDFSILDDGDVFKGIETDLELSSSQTIKNAQRVDGELYITLCQKSQDGHWTGIDEWIETQDYQQGKLYIKEVTGNG